MSEGRDKKAKARLTQALGDSIQRGREIQECLQRLVRNYDRQAEGADLLKRDYMRLRILLQEQEDIAIRTTDDLRGRGYEVKYDGTAFKSPGLPRPTKRIINYITGWEGSL